MDGNAWELVEEEPKESARRSRSPSKDRQSKLSRASETRFEFAGRELDVEELSNIIDEQIKKESERRTQRGRSPAVDSLRKIGRIVLEKVGVKKKRLDAVPFDRTRDLETVPLERYCEKPIMYTMEDRMEPTLMPRVVSTNLLKDYRNGLKEKCSYLFRSAEEDTFVDVMDGTKPPERVHIYDPYCPVHGSKRRLTRRKLVDMHSFVNSVDTADHEQLSPILYSQAYIAKVMRKRKRANLTGAEKFKVEKSKHKIRINLWIISVAFLFLFTAFHGLQNLQTTVNGQMGADSLCALYVSMAISSLFVPTFILNRLGSKLTLVVSIGIYILYMIANFLPKYYSLIPTSVLAGVASSCLWAANCVYITESGIKYAKLNVEAQNVVIVRFFGYFFMVVHLGQVIGNIVSSMIFIMSTPTIVDPYDKDKVDRTCGNGFQENISLLSPRAQKNLEHPSEYTYRSVVGVDLCCAIVAMMIVVMFLNSLKKDELERTKKPHFTIDVLRIMAQNLTRPKPLLLIPLTIFNGMEQAFAVGLYTKAYVACGLGISQIGFVMTSFGVADAICSLVFGPLIKLFGRMPLFVFGAVINMLMIVTLMIWPLNPDDRALFNVMAGVWGMADGVWNTQVNGFWVALVGRNGVEMAFANYRFYCSLGLAIGFALIRFTKIDMYLSISFIVLLLGMLGYFLIELYETIRFHARQVFDECGQACGWKVEKEEGDEIENNPSLVEEYSSEEASQKLDEDKNQLKSKSHSIIKTKF